MEIVIATDCRWSHGFYLFILKSQRIPSLRDVPGEEWGNSQKCHTTTSMGLKGNSFVDYQGHFVLIPSLQARLGSVSGFSGKVLVDKSH